MSNRANEIRRRIAKRKRSRYPSPTNPHKSVPPFLANDEERFGGSTYASFDGGGSGDGGHPLFRKEVFLFKVLLSAILVLSIGIIFKNQSPNFEKVRHFVSSTMETEFQFAAVTEWYKDTFGSPLALLPINQNKEQVDAPEPGKYALPAAGTVTETFEANGQGIIVETDSKVVEAMNAGNVTEVAVKGDLGKTVVIQHSDGTETWYGNLGSVNVKLYDYVETGQEVGQVQDPEGENKGTYYFAIKQGETFIDPIQVIKFE
ncbi:peptidoglycan DD-metalloendopeptidase family protein [Fredinandcohnia salidurans]|uniref:Peptidoglycan DD-metalloendopeptidase family protein n=1 Tax=Fredinandcohnia salidurans TaxID=2595041 RepID=A0ABW4MT24_9BACI|nr:M23 family metallopeptidase [Fredinandcohnia onubensis]